MTDYIRSDNVCSECKKNIPLSKKEQIGKTVMRDFSVGKGYSRTEFPYFQW